MGSSVPAVSNVSPVITYLHKTPSKVALRRLVFVHPSVTFWSWKLRKQLYN